MNTKIFARYIVREIMGLVVMGAALFWSAGKTDWRQGWVALAVVLAWTIATAVVILRIHPDLLAERLGPRKGAKWWDTTIMSLLGAAQLARYIVAGLDQRNGWTGGMPAAVEITALIVCILGYALVTWATASNAFFSQIVRLQPERGQRVAKGGPYRYVRHPAYVGAILFELAVPFLLASWPALIIGGFTALLLVARTALEDRTLQAELAGYSDYAQDVRQRLVPGVW